MTQSNKTLIVFVVDRSASMRRIASAMSQGFNEFIEKQKLVPGECYVTAYQFDDTCETLFVERALSSVPTYSLQPRGNTALLDAVAKAIDETGQRLSQTPDWQRPSQVLFVIITDGEENASKTFNLLERGRERVFDKITHQRSKYQWEFIYLGANQDSIAVATSLGISATNSVTYKAEEKTSGGLMRGLSANVASYRSSGKATMDNLYNQASYESHVADVDPKLSVGVTKPDLASLLAGGAKLSIDAQPAMFPPGTVVTTTTTTAMPIPVSPPDSSQS